jgi:hypothetical protein
MAIEKKTKEKEASTQTEESVFEAESKELNTEDTVENVKTEEKAPMFSLEQVQKLMQDAEERFKNMLNTQVGKLKLGKAKEALDEDLDYVRELEDDWLENPVVFFSFSINFSIFGDRRRGVQVLPPQGAVKFTPLIRTKRKGRRNNTEVVSVSSVKVHSKEVVDYLRNHSQFGIKFYENMGSAMNVDSVWAQKMVEAQQSISRLSDMQIIARAKQEGIAVEQSPEAMRKQLIEKIAKAQIAKHEATLYGSVMNSKIDKSTGRQVIDGHIPDNVY